MIIYIFVILFLNELHHEKTGFLHMRKQRCRSAVQYGTADQCPCFAKQIVQFLFYLGLNFQASRILLRL